jgi:hypothetical protein
MSKTSPTQRALALCKSLGWRAGIVEKWNQWARIRQDLFGFCDLVVLDGRPGVLAIQVTSGNNVPARVKKLDENPAVVDWLRAGGRVEVWGYQKRGARGKAKRWTLRRVRARLIEVGEVKINGRWERNQLEHVLWDDPMTIRIRRVG